jgi:hypothetical protein
VRRAWRTAPPSSEGQSPSFDPQPGWSVRHDRLGGQLLFGPSPPGAGPRRWAERDRFGTSHLLAVWDEASGELDWAAVRSPGGWAIWELGTALHPLWGRCDRMLSWGAAETPCRVASQPFGDLRFIPPLERPAELPPGAGEALLNLLATFMADQGRGRVVYRGPFPTAHLFEALCRSFAPLEPEAEARARFSQGELAQAFAAETVENPVAWRPDPWGAVQPTPGVLVRVRYGPETAWIGAVPFRRSGKAASALPAGERIWAPPETEGEYAAGLALLGEPFREFLRLDAKGNVLRDAPPAEASEAGAALSESWREPLFAWAALRAAPPLAPAVLALRPDLPLRWARLPLSLASCTGGELWISSALSAQWRRLRGSRDPSELALMAFSDVACAVAPHLLRLAQTRLEAGPPSSPEALLHRGAEARQRAGALLAQSLPRLVQSLRCGEALPVPE